MKTKVLSLVAMFLFGTVTLIAQSSVEKFKVYGNCGMCKSTIDKAAKSVDGVSKADWNKETKIMVLAFDKSKTDIHKIHMAIAKSGYDTEMHKADDKAYNALPGCCQYERAVTDKKMKGDEGHMH